MSGNASIPVIGPTLLASRVAQHQTCRTYPV